ncbi:MAG: hypothetical protein JXO51_06470 [Candidatus Aminicenantes bacterium]|nr:hypothetical protein [Candidatus Aminicenantes bacterium]
MGLSDLFLPERRPRQIVFAGDRHAEIIRLHGRRATERARLEGVVLADCGSCWPEVLERLQPVDTGVVFSAVPFIYNFFEFDRLPWKKKALRELVTWRLQKIFPDNIESYDHRFYTLPGKKVFSILVRKSLPDAVEEAFRARGIPLTFIGNSTMEIARRLPRAGAAPDFFIESDRASCTVVFQQRRAPFYIRKFKSGSGTDTVEEVGKTVGFVRGQYGVEPRRYWLVDHQDEAAAAALEAGLGGAGLLRLRAGLGAAPHIPGHP